MGRAALVNKSFGLAIPQDAAGLPWRLMTNGPRYNEVVCLGSVLVNSSVSPSGPVRAQHLYKSLTISALTTAADLCLPPPSPSNGFAPSPDPALADHYYPPQIQVTALMGKK